MRLIVAVVVFWTNGMLKFCRSETSMYHSVGNCVFLFLEAVLTFEHEHIVRASEAIKQCLSVCNRHRKKNTITESIGKTFKRVSFHIGVLRCVVIVLHLWHYDIIFNNFTLLFLFLLPYVRYTYWQHNYEQYTELEAHAELCSAEALLLKALLTFIEDETLTSLIKGGIKIRTCFNSYKYVCMCIVYYVTNIREIQKINENQHFSELIHRECRHILEKLQWESPSSKVHFESGVRMGVGTFNLMISLLPARIIRLLEFIGFSGNKVKRINYYKSTFHLKRCFFFNENSKLEFKI